MNMKISKVLLVSLLSLGVLVGCNQTTQDSSSNSSSSSISSVSVNSIGQLNTIKDALDYISDHNSSYEVRVDRASQIANYRWIFTPIYSYVAYNSGIDYTYAGFITTPQGIASYSLERSDTSDDVITTGEAILDANGNTVTSLYDNSTVTSLVNLDYSSLDTSSTSLKTSRRVFCESILKLANLLYMSYMDSINTTYMDAEIIHMVVHEPELEIVKDVNVTTVENGTYAKYNITVTNNGHYGAYDVTITDNFKELFGDVKNNNNQNYITKGDSDSSASFDDLEKITKAIVINQDESDSLPTFSNEKKSLFETTDKTIINVP